MSYAAYQKRKQLLNEIYSNDKAWTYKSLGEHLGVMSSNVENKITLLRKLGILEKRKKPDATPKEKYEYFPKVSFQEAMKIIKPKNLKDIPTGCEEILAFLKGSPCLFTRTEIMSFTRLKKTTVHRALDFLYKVNRIKCKDGPLGAKLYYTDPEYCDLVNKVASAVKENLPAGALFKKYYC